MKRRVSGPRKDSTNPQTIAAVITAAGKSIRMAGVRKALALVDGVPVLKKAVDAFADSGKVGPIVITYPPGEADLQSVFGGGDSDFIWVAGGETRQESVYNALLALNEHAPEYVLIHDAARPWVSWELIDAVLRGTIQYGACIPVVPHVNAPKQVNDLGEIIAHFDRAVVLGAQTPQGFRFADIFSAHQTAMKNGLDYPDDAEAYHHAVGSVFTVPGDPANRKITFKYDLS